jgi:hypothetical protein
VVEVQELPFSGFHTRQTVASVTISTAMSGESPNAKWAVCTCNNCSGHLEFDVSNAGETIQCPHCKLDTVLFIPQIPLAPHKGGLASSAKGWLLLGGVLIAGLLLAVFVPTRRDSRPQSAGPTENQSSNKTERITGAFGWTLGEKIADAIPLEKIEATGSLEYFYDPGKTNSPFYLISVSVDTNHII